MRRTPWVLGAIAALLFSSCSWGGGSDDYDVVAYFTDVGDLVEKATVQVNDVEVGSVDDIALVLREGEMLAEVSMSLDDSARISSAGLTAVVRQTSLLGEQFVQLVPASDAAPYLGAETTVISADETERRVDVETFLSDLSSFVGGGGLEDLNRFVHAQAVILEDRGARFGDEIHQLNRFITVLANRKTDIARAIDHLASASGTLAGNKQTLNDFLDSFEDASAILADQGGELGRLFGSLRRFGEFNARFLARHEAAIDRGFRSLRPIIEGVAGARAELGNDIEQLRVFLELFPKSFGGGPSSKGKGDYIQVDAVLCEKMPRCHTSGEKGDVPGQGR